MRASTIKSYVEVLREALARKQAERPTYSLAILARDLDLSKPYLSRVLSGKKAPSAKFLSQICSVLKLSAQEKRDLYLSLCFESLPTQQCQHYFLQEIDLHRKVYNDESFVSLENDFVATLTRWQTMAILQLVSTPSFEPNPTWIAQRLNTSIAEVNEALALLFHHQLLVEEEGQWRRTHQRLTFQEETPNQVYTAYQKQMLQRQLEELEHQNRDREKRFLSSLTVATRPEHINELKEHLTQSMNHSFNILKTDEPTEVYQLNIGFIPLSH